MVFLPCAHTPTLPLHLYNLAHTPLPPTQSRTPTRLTLMVFLLSCAEVEAGEASPLRSPELLTERARPGGTMAGPPLPLVDRRLGGALADRRLDSS